MIAKFSPSHKVLCLWVTFNASCLAYQYSTVNISITRVPKFSIYLAYGYSNSKIHSVRYSWILYNDGSIVGKVLAPCATLNSNLQNPSQFCYPSVPKVGWQVGIGESLEAHKPASLIYIAANKALPQTKWKTEVEDQRPRLSWVTYFAIGKHESMCIHACTHTPYMYICTHTSYTKKDFLKLCSLNIIYLIVVQQVFNGLNK